MQDRFRFRAWNFKENKYYQQNEKGMFKLGGELPNGTSVGVLCSVEDLTNNRNYGKNFVVEQCTGLKDKNGKLIYEGDVVSLVPEIEKIKYVVKWDEYNAQLFLDALNKRVRIDFNTIDLKLEVVGNIHENPELLED